MLNQFSILSISIVEHGKSISLWPLYQQTHPWFGFPLPHDWPLGVTWSDCQPQMLPAFHPWLDQQHPAQIFISAFLCMVVKCLSLWIFPTKQISPNCTCMLTKKATETKGVEACSLWTISECINCKTPQNPTWWFPLRLPYAECPQRKYHKYLPTPALRMTMWGKTRMSFWRLQVYWQHKRLKDRRIWTKR